MKSMTGYAKVQCICGERKFNIEIKTLNSKQLDLAVKMPSCCRSHELEVRALLGALERGKVDFIMTEERAADNVSLNAALLISRYEALSTLAKTLGASTDNLLASLVGNSDVWGSGTDDECTNEQWAVIREGIVSAIAQVEVFRTDEGRVLERDFRLHVGRIEHLLGQVPAFEQERVETAKERIRRYMADADIHEVDSNRFEQELIYYLEKLDITEEKVRLQKHIDYFRTTMDTEPSCGKKLGFVAQEMGREINTTGSKANHVEIQRLVVAMKDELEKIKEQLGNVL